MKPAVFISARISKQAMDLLHQHCAVRLNKSKGPLEVDELMGAVQGVEGMLCAFNDTINERFIEGASHLKVISSFSAGYDNIDVQAATKHKIIITNTSSAVMEATADLTWGLLITVARRIIEGDNYVRRENLGRTIPPGTLTGFDIFGKTLGIIGMGHIGQAVARRAKGFNMPVLYYQRRRLENHLEKEFRAKYVSLKELLKNSDFVSLHIPLTKGTKHLLGEKEFAQMKGNAFLINASRGPVLDESALVEALKGKTIAGAALDVYENEPAITPGLTGLANVVLTPHIGGSTPGTLRKMALLAAQNLIDVVEGRRPQHVVNPEVLQF